MSMKSYSYGTRTCTKVLKKYYYVNTCTHIIYSANILANTNEDIMIQFLNSVLTMLARIGASMINLTICNFQINVQCSIVHCICSLA